MDFEQRSGTVQLGQKALGVPLPAGSEAFRTGIKVVAICYGYTKVRYPQNSRLVYWSMQLFQDYVDLFFGTEVWDFISVSKGKVVFSPALGHVLGFEQALRDRAEAEIHSGFDIANAFEVAMAYDKIRLRHFHTPVAIAAATTPWLTPLVPEALGSLQHRHYRRGAETSACSWGRCPLGQPT